MTNNGTYTLPQSSDGALLVHGFGNNGQPWLLRDNADDTKLDMDIEAFAASGDCLITMATTLDEATEQLADPETARLKIEKVTSTLLYLQRRYKLVHKTPEHRQ